MHWARSYTRSSLWTMSTGIWLLNRRQLRVTHGDSIARTAKLQNHRTRKIEIEHVLVASCSLLPVRTVLSPPDIVEYMCIDDSTFYRFSFLGPRYAIFRRRYSSTTPSKSRSMDTWRDHRSEKFHPSRNTIFLPGYPSWLRKRQRVPSVFTGE